MRVRINFGSHPEISRVLAWDHATQRAAVVLSYRDGTTALDVVGFGDLEMTLPDGNTYGTADQLAQHLRRRAAVIINPE